MSEQSAFEQFADMGNQFDTVISDSEYEATKLSTSPYRLLKRLQAAVSVLRDRYQAEFKPQSKQSFDFIAKRLYGGNGFYLQWQTRDDPQAPESYDNQQTTVGCCTLYRQ